MNDSLALNQVSWLKERLAGRHEITQVFDLNAEGSREELGAWEAFTKITIRQYRRLVALYYEQDWRSLKMTLEEMGVPKVEVAELNREI